MPGKNIGTIMEKSWVEIGNVIENSGRQHSGNIVEKRVEQTVEEIMAKNGQMM